ncbi:MAG: hypothetical protein SGJ20_20150 [Planctomycetota bacterium]|nr:hypothetical protein [Planctomycetota bacterium]
MRTHNGWSLYGLARSLQMQNKPDSTAAKAEFDAAWKDADVKITSSCFCQPVSGVVKSKP